MADAQSKRAGGYVDLVFIYGPPGVGKLTVAMELSRLTGYKLFDNHASIDVIRRVFDFSDEPFWPLVRRLRFDVLEQAVKYDISLISTGAYAHGKDTANFERGIGMIEGHGGRACLVHLLCEIDVLEERVQSEGRINKMHSLETARADMAVNDYFTPLPGRDSLAIDNTNVTPEDAARRIADHYGLRVVEAS